MGLLLGHVDESSQVAYIQRSIVLQRSDKKKDRVEISYEKLVQASTIAERLSEVAGTEKRPMRILGWYHSHPHITVIPSHVDVRTQSSYQQLESGFIGIIFSVFDKGNLETCAFQALQIQSSNDSAPIFERIEIPIVLGNIEDSQKFYRPLATKTSLESLLALQSSLFHEDFCAFSYLRQHELRVACGAISRNCIAYQSALQRKIDHQVIPLQMVTTTIYMFICNLKHTNQYGLM